MTGAKKPVAKMKSTGSAKKTTVSRGSTTKVQVGNQNQLENSRAGKINNQSFPKVTAAQAKENKGKKPTEKRVGSEGVRNMQRAGGSKNLSNQEMYSRANAKPKGKGPRGR